jgi:hypothetical protein
MKRNSEQALPVPGQREIERTVRGPRWNEMVLQDLRFALRTLRKIGRAHV